MLSIVKWRHAFVYFSEEVVYFYLRRCSRLSELLLYGWWRAPCLPWSKKSYRFYNRHLLPWAYDKPNTCKRRNGQTQNENLTCRQTWVYFAPPLPPTRSSDLTSFWLRRDTRHCHFHLRTRRMDDATKARWMFLETNLILVLVAEFKYCRKTIRYHSFEMFGSCIGNTYSA